MKKVFVTGATGNIGRAVIKHLYQSSNEIEVTAGVRNISQAQPTFSDFPKLLFQEFDFEKKESYENTLSNFDTLFLLRPPHISNIETFIPLMEAIKKAGISEIVFLSVQGADKSKIIPHNKIERLIKEYEIPYIFVRPAYFMQNLTTTLHQEIKEKRSITLPSGGANFNWVDVEDIAASTAQLISNFEKYQGQALDITGTELASFQTVVNLINEQIENKITYKRVGPLKFYRLKKREGMKKGFIMVMLVLHYLPRFQKDPQLSDNVKKLTGNEPTKLVEFIQREIAFFQ